MNIPMLSATHRPAPAARAAESGAGPSLVGGRRLRQRRRRQADARACATAPPAAATTTSTRTSRRRRQRRANAGERAPPAPVAARTRGVVRDGVESRAPRELRRPRRFSASVDRDERVNQYARRSPPPSAALIAPPGCRRTTLSALGIAGEESKITPRRLARAVAVALAVAVRGRAMRALALAGPLVFAAIASHIRRFRIFPQRRRLRFHRRIPRIGRGAVDAARRRRPARAGSSFGVAAAAVARGPVLPARHHGAKSGNVERAGVHARFVRQPRSAHTSQRRRRARAWSCSTRTMRARARRSARSPGRRAPRARHGVVAMTASGRQRARDPSTTGVCAVSEILTIALVATLASRTRDGTARRRRRLRGGADARADGAPARG